MNDVMQLLHETSPFEGFNTASFPVDLQGWGSDDAIFAQAIATKRPKIIVEVGTWKGRSAINMAKIVKSLGLDCTIICVDTWLGSPEHFLGGDPAWRTSLLFKHGYPQLYFTFLSNVIHSNVMDIIVPLPTTSENAAIILKAKGIRPDIVYVDGAHEEAPAYRDFKTYFDLLSPEGILIGDDYLLSEEVTRAANRFASEVQRPIFGTWSKFAVSRSPNNEPRITFGGTNT